MFAVSDPLSQPVEHGLGLGQALVGTGDRGSRSRPERR
jgi:hypothetical protein